MDDVDVNDKTEVDTEVAVDDTNVDDDVEADVVDILCFLDCCKVLKFKEISELVLLLFFYILCF